MKTFSKNEKKRVFITNVKNFIPLLKVKNYSEFFKKVKSCFAKIEFLKKII